MQADRSPGDSQRAPGSQDSGRHFAPGPVSSTKKRFGGEGGLRARVRDEVRGEFSGLRQGVLGVEGTGTRGTRVAAAGTEAPPGEVETETRKRAAAFPDSSEGPSAGHPKQRTGPIRSAGDPPIRSLPSTPFRWRAPGLWGVATLPSAVVLVLEMKNRRRSRALRKGKTGSRDGVRKRALGRRQSGPPHDRCCHLRTGPVTCHCHGCHPGSPQTWTRRSGAFHAGSDRPGRETLSPRPNPGFVASLAAPSPPPARRRIKDADKEAVGVARNKWPRRFGGRRVQKAANCLYPAPGDGQRLNAQEAAV